jgi:hypothetical protein
MSGSAVLERRYRRLLAWYPRSFRCEQEDEMLAVLMAGARQGQQRPGLLETSDVLRSALGMRLILAMRSPWPEPRNQRWTDALALFSTIAPVAGSSAVGRPFPLHVKQDRAAAAAPRSGDYCPVGSVVYSQTFR